jgi:hypothetical protein
MLKTKVMLNFPSSSAASKWVEIVRLIPLIESKNMVVPGTIYDSCLAVAQLPAFKKLVNAAKSGEAENQHGDDTTKTMGDGVNVFSGTVDENNDMVDQDSYAATNKDNDDEDQAEVLHLAKIKRRVFIAVTEIAPQGLDADDAYEVEKLRQKRIRLFKPDSNDVTEFNLSTDAGDPWVQRLQRVSINLNFK